MKEAYVHPAEKNLNINPIQIWNDSYNFLKTINPDNMEGRKKRDNEYEHIIRREVGAPSDNEFIEQIL